MSQCKTCRFIDSSTTISAPKFVYHIKHQFTCTSSHLIYCISCSILKTGFGEHRRAVTSNDANQPVARHFNNGSHCVSDMKIRALCPIFGSNDSRKRHEMRLISKLGTALSTLLALMNVLVTFNAHLLCLTHSLIDSPSFLFFTPFCSVYLSLCLVLYYATRFTFLCLHFVLMKSIWLTFILSRDVFVLTRIKTRVVFPDPPTTNSWRRAFIFCVSLNTLPTLATLVRDKYFNTFLTYMSS